MKILYIFILGFMLINFGCGKQATMRELILAEIQRLEVLESEFQWDNNRWCYVIPFKDVENWKVYFCRKDK